MKKMLNILVLGTFLFSLSGFGIANIYAYPSQQRDLNRQNNHDRQWQNNHDQQWRNHNQEWQDHDREWRNHDGDRRWQEEHAHQWNDWYQWHNDNGDEGFNNFLFGVVLGAILTR